MTVVMSANHLIFIKSLILSAKLNRQYTHWHHKRRFGEGS